MRIGKLEIRWHGYSKWYAKKMIKKIYTETLAESEVVGDHRLFAAKIRAIKWHRNYTNMVREEYCELKESKELVERIMKLV